MTITLRKLVKYCNKIGVKTLVLTQEPPGGLKEAGTEHFTDNLPLLSCFVGQGDYKVGIGLGEELKAKLKAFNPSVIHITTPDFANKAALE